MLPSGKHCLFLYPPICGDLRDVLVYHFRGDFQKSGVLDEAVYELKHACIVVAVDRALVHDKFAIDILALNGSAVTVKLMHMALCAERYEHGEVPKL